MKNKVKKNTKPEPLSTQKAFRVVLPVLAGLVFIVITAIIVAIATTPGKNPAISNKDEIYLKLNEYNVTYEKLYGITKFNYGITELVALVDDDLLKNETYTDEIKEEVIRNLVFSSYSDEDYEDLTQKEKDEKLTDFRESLIYSGINTDAEYDKYLDLQYRRYAYAKRVFPKWVKDNDFSAAQYLEAFDIVYKKDYTSTADAILLTFISEAHATSIWKRFDINLENVTSTYGYYFESVEEARKQRYADLTADIARYKGQMEAIKKDYQDTKPGENYEEDDLYIEAKANLEVAEDDIVTVGKTVYLTRVEVELLYINIYNYLYAYYQGGDADTYYDANGDLIDAYRLLVEGVHYEIEHVDAVMGEDTEGNPVEEKAAYSHVKWLITDFTDYNDYVRVRYTGEEATAIDSSVKSQLFSSLAIPDRARFITSTTTSIKAGTNYRFMAILFDRFEPEMHNYDFELDPGEKDDDEETVGPSQEIRDEIRDYMIEDKFNNEYQSLMLVLLRAENGLKIYDRYLDHVYGASLNSLNETLLGTDNYTAYKYNKKTHKTVVFEYKVNNTKVQVTADQLFTNLRTKYGVIGAVSLITNHIVLNDPAYNTVYIPATGKVLDADKLKEAINSFNYMNLYNGTLGSVKEWKYAFENNSFESYGFPKSYGWKQFLNDYLQMKDENELAANVLIQDAYELFYKDTYDYNDIVERITDQWNKYFSMQVINVLVTVDYNLDGKPDEYVVDKDKDQKYWTDEQMALAKQLTALVYSQATLTGESGLEAQLTAVVNDYKEAEFTDPLWGKYKQHGLLLKAESKASYDASSGLVQEFIDEMIKFYHEIEAAGRLGETLDAPQIMDKVFPTVYGYHQVALAGSSNRVVIDEDDYSLAKLLEFLTEENYERYLKIIEAEADAEDDIEISEDEEMTPQEKTGFSNYYLPAIEALKKDAFVDLYYANLRNTNFTSGLWSFPNAEDYAKYQSIQAKIYQEVLEAYNEAIGLNKDGTPKE